MEAIRNISIQKVKSRPNSYIYKLSLPSFVRDILKITEDDRQVTVIVSGSESIVNAIDTSSIRAYVDLKDYTVGEWDVPVQVTGNDLKLSYESKVRKVKIRITEAK